MTNTEPTMIVHEEHENFYVPHYDHSRPERIKLLHKALDWLDANPDRHTMATLARDADERTCEPNDPDARCFCVLGRMVVEGGLAPAQSPDGDRLNDTFYPTLEVYVENFAHSCGTIFGEADRCRPGMSWEKSAAANRAELRRMFPLEPDF